jgi:hypothetical protein
MQAIAPGVISLLHGTPPAARAAGGGVWRVYLILLLVLVIQVVGMGRTLGLVRRWHARTGRPTGWRAGLVHIGLPLALNLGWAGAILVGLPAVSGFSLQFLGYLYPDVIATLTVSAVVALGWAILRTALVMATPRGTDTPIAGPRPTSGPTGRPSSAAMEPSPGVEP